MITETIKAYKEILNNVDVLISKSGYKINWIEKELNMDKVSFYKKRKHKRFTIDELERLMKIIRADELEDKVLNEMSERAEAENDRITLKEALQYAEY